MEQFLYQILDEFLRRRDFASSVIWKCSQKYIKVMPVLEIVCCIAQYTYWMQTRLAVGELGWMAWEIRKYKVFTMICYSLLTRSARYRFLYINSLSAGSIEWLLWMWNNFGHIAHNTAIWSKSTPNFSSRTWLSWFAMNSILLNVHGRFLLFKKQYMASTRENKLKREQKLFGSRKWFIDKISAHEFPTILNLKSYQRNCRTVRLTLDGTYCGKIFEFEIGCVRSKLRGPMDVLAQFFVRCVGICSQILWLSAMHAHRR